MSHVSEVQLTVRQAEVLQLLASGLTADEIGHSLRISTRTARAHIDILKRKVGATRSRDVAMAYRRLTGADPVVLEIGAFRGAVAST